MTKPMERKALARPPRNVQQVHGGDMEWEDGSKGETYRSRRGDTYYIRRLYPSGRVEWCVDTTTMFDAAYDAVRDGTRRLTEAELTNLLMRADSVENVELLPIRQQAAIRALRDEHRRRHA